MSIIKTEDLSYEYISPAQNEKEAAAVKVHAIRGVSLDVQSGQFIGIAGRNGSGKSTLARHLNALLIPTGGTVIIAGMDTKNEKDHLSIRENAGMIFQNPDNQIVAPIVEDDAAFGPENLGVPTNSIIQRVARALKMTGMEKHAKSSTSKLSGGQKQRTAIAGVMAMQPTCMILDEPTAMLDPEGREEVMREIGWLNREKGMTIILITHYMEELTAADVIYVMDEGRIALSGTPEEVFLNVDRIKELGLEAPPMTQLAFELRKDGIDIPGTIFTPEEMADAICRSYSKM